MFSDVTPHLVYQVLNASLREYPYPHFFNTGMFPEAFYAEIMMHMPAEDDYQTLLEQGLVRVTPDMVETYNQRNVIGLTSDHIEMIDESNRGFWLEFTKILSSPDFLTSLLLMFKPWIIDRFGKGVEFNYEVHIDLIRDSEKWALGPHTDQPRNIAVLLLYLPPDDTTSYLGTSIYTPKEPGFTCEGGPHHSREKFYCANTLPYLPNSAVGFFMNNTSFHGVNSVKKAGDVRNLIQLSIMEKN